MQFLVADWFWEKADLWGTPTVTVVDGQVEGRVGWSHSSQNSFKDTF